MASGALGRGHHAARPIGIVSSVLADDPILFAVAAENPALSIAFQARGGEITASTAPVTFDLFGALLLHTARAVTTVAPKCPAAVTIGTTDVAATFALRARLCRNLDDVLFALLDGCFDPEL